jgi:hypothetical protein
MSFPVILVIIVDFIIALASVDSTCSGVLLM